jgi:hypothetical protein
MIVPYGVSKPVVPVNLLATVAVCMLASCRKVRATRNSFQAPMNHDDRCGEDARSRERQDHLTERHSWCAAIHHRRAVLRPWVGRRGDETTIQ